MRKIRSFTVIPNHYKLYLIWLKEKKDLYKENQMFSEGI